MVSLSQDLHKCLSQPLVCFTTAMCLLFRPEWKEEIRNKLRFMFLDQMTGNGELKRRLMAGPTRRCDFRENN